MKPNHDLFAAEITKRNIQCLVHFTPTINLVGMCETGYILPRHELMKLDLFNEEMSDYTEFTDEVRLDGDKYINTSIQHPNDFLLKKFKERSKDKPWVRWCVIKINPKYIYDDETLFSVTNAANRYNRENVGITGDFEKFKSMFADTLKVVSANYSIEKHRTELPDNLTTDPQAEVLIKKKIPLEDILEIAFENEEDLVSTRNAIGNIPCRLSVDTHIFQDRTSMLTHLYSTEVTIEDTVVPEGEEYCYYSLNGKRFVKFCNHWIDEYKVKEGTELICDWTFWDLYNEIDFYYIKKLYLPYSLKAIGKNAFCGSIENIVCDSPFFKIERKSLLSADGKTFYKYFGNEKDFYIPNSVVSIIGGAFAGMEMNSITIPSSVTHIGDNPIAGIYNRRNNSSIINVECLSNKFEIRNNCLFDKDTKHLISYLGDDKNVEIYDVNSIGANAFYEKKCEVLTVRSSDISYIDEEAFHFCFNLKAIYVGTLKDKSSLFTTHLRNIVNQHPF